MISEIARPAGIHVSQLFRWRKELCRIEEPKTETANTLVPVIVSEDRAGSLSSSTGTADHIPYSSEAQRRND